MTKEITKEIVNKLVDVSVPAAADQPRVRAGHEPHQPPGSDPAGQEGEGAGVQHGDGARAASPPRVRHAGEGQHSDIQLLSSPDQQQ